MAAKVERAKRQRMEAGKLEGSKSCWRTWRDGAGIGPREMQSMVASFKGPMVVCPAGKAAGLSRSIGTEGKGRRTATTTTFGNGERTHGRAAWWRCV